MVEFVRVGLVGTGKFARHHATVWQDIPMARLVGVHGSDGARLDAFAGATGIPAMASYEQLLAASDLVDIVSAHDTHAAYAIPAIQRVRGVLIEKPLEITTERAEAICRAAAARRITASVIAQSRFQRGFRLIKCAMEQSSIGQVALCRVVAIWPRTDVYYAASGGWRGDPRRAGGGALMQNGIHVMDLLHWWFGPAVAVSGGLGPEASGESIERTCWGFIEFAQGTRCELSLSTWPAAASRTEVELIGAKGTLATDGDAVWVRQQGLRGTLRNGAERIAQRLRPRSTPNRMVRAQCMDVLRAMGSGRSPLSTLDAGLEALSTVQALYRAAREGRRVSLAPTATVQ